MNKSIKRKKRIEMSPKKSFTKDELLFLKQYPRLFAMCSYYKTGVNRLELKKIHKKVIKYKFMSKDEFQISIRMILFRIDYDDINFKEGSYGEYYFNLYKSLGVTFKDNEGNIKLKC